MTQQQDQRPYPGQVNQFGTPVHPVGVPSVVPFGHAPARGTDPMAVWGFVLSLLFWPVGLGLSIGSMVRTRRHGLDGRGLAVAGLVISLVHLVLLPVLAAVAIPVFLNQREKAVEVALRSDLSAAAITMETARVDLGSYPLTLTRSQPLAATTDDVVLVEVAADSFCLRAHAGDEALYRDELGTTSPYGCP